LIGKTFIVGASRSLPGGT